ncbi:MAG: hypothetical protein EOP83_34155, partial [Verrucomicrobiaceae bacterium]
MVELYFACFRLGVIFVPLNPYLKGRFLEHQLRDSEPSIIIADREGLEALRQSSSAMPSIPLLVVGANEEDESPGSLEHLYHSSPLGQGNLAVDGASDAVILYTSGTTGQSKGCLLSQANLVKVGAVMRGNWRVQPEDKLFTAFPLFHSAGLVASIFAMLVSGASYHNTAGFSASSFMLDAVRLKATIILGPGAVGQALLARSVHHDDKNHTLRLASFVPFPVSAQERFTARFGVDLWTETYAQTECLLISMSSIDDRRRGSIGKPSPLVELAIQDDHGEPVAIGSPGEIVIRPRTTGAMFKGYWKRPEATLGTWRNLWHRTGDRGYLDQDGFLHFLDRMRDAIRRRGENICSAELEAAILENPKIEAVAVHAVPSAMTEDDI